MVEGIFIQWEIIAGVGIPATAAAIAIIRHLWNKSKCFIILKQKVEELSKSDQGSSETHGDLYEKYNEISTRLATLEGKIDILVNK